MIDRFIKYFQLSEKLKPRVLQWVLLWGEKKRDILSFLPLSQIPAAWLLTIYLLPSFSEEKPYQIIFLPAALPPSKVIAYLQPIFEEVPEVWNTYAL